MYSWVLLLGTSVGFTFSSFPLPAEGKSLLNKRKAESFLHVRGFQEPQLEHEMSLDL